MHFFISDAKVRIFPKTTKQGAFFFREKVQSRKIPLICPAFGKRFFKRKMDFPEKTIWCRVREQSEPLDTAAKLRLLLHTYKYPKLAFFACKMAQGVENFSPKQMKFVVRMIFLGGFLSVVGATTYIGCSDRPTKIFPRLKRNMLCF